MTTRPKPAPLRSDHARYKNFEGPSILGHVSAHGPRLAREFFAWVRDTIGAVADEEWLFRWEVEHFGDRLYPSAHGVLWFVIVNLGEGARGLSAAAAQDRVAWENGARPPEAVPVLEERWWDK